MTSPLKKARGRKQRKDLKGMQLSKLNLTDARHYTLRYPDSEFLYLRENDFSRFDPGIMLVNLKVLDLCQNRLVNVDFLHLLPQLRHLYLTGNCIERFEGFHDLEELETLCMSSNRIPSFEGLGMLPNLRILSITHNLICDYKFFPFLPSLSVLNLHGNPLTANELHRKLAIAVCSGELGKIDRQEVTPAELEETQLYRGKIAFCITEGFMAEESGFSVAEQADKFLLTKQRENTRQQSLVLQHIHLDTTLCEGSPVTLQVCLQDRRPLAERKATKFQSNQIYPVELTVQGEAQQVLLVGSMNNWREPLELEKCLDGPNVFFHTTLYLPPGEYEYRYIVDGEEKVSEHTKAISKFNDTVCNLYKVTGVAEDLDPNSSTLLHIRWLRSNINSGFDLIEGENSLVHVPGCKDVGACLRAEVLSYLNGQFEALVFDITPPITCGPPLCLRLELQGEPVESGELTALYTYSGGPEGDSTFQWIRIGSNGGETILTVDGPAYRVGVADVGSKLKVVYTPIRDDATVGEPQSVCSPAIIPAPPVARGLTMLGTFVEGEPITLETEYYGGHEGGSRYGWYRQHNGAYLPIAGASGKSYVPTVEDVDQFLTAEYIPVSDKGRQGDAVRTDSPAIAAGKPSASVRLVGDFQVGGAAGLEVTYRGGRPGTPLIQWYRLDQGGNALFFVPPNPLSYTVTAADKGFILGLQYTPVRADGLRGETINIVHPNPIGSPGGASGGPIVRPAVLVEGQTAELDAVPKGRIEWHVSDEQGRNFTLMPMATNCRSIALTGAEAYRKLKVMYTPAVGGMDGAVVTTETDFVQPGPPKATDVRLAVEGGVYQGAFTYSGGRPGAHIQRWVRVTPAQQEVVAAETTGHSARYWPVAEDVGCQLIYAVRPARMDGVQGAWVRSARSAVLRQPDLPPADLPRRDSALAQASSLAKVSSFTQPQLPVTAAAKNPLGAWGSAASLHTPSLTGSGSTPSLATSSWRLPVATNAGIGAWGAR